MHAAIMPACSSARWSAALFNLISLHSLWGWLFVLAAPLLIKQARYVMRELSPAAMPPMLERTVKARC